MSGEALYERYKEALRRGHVASLRGHLEEALTAYAEAAAIAPERATPHTSAGTALMRRKRPMDALRHYATALTLSPRDEAALLGRAQALAALDRRPEAADAFHALSEARAAGGKLADAVDAARRGLELAEGRERRRNLERLIERLRASEPGEPGRAALDRALLVLDGVAVAEVTSAPVVHAEPAANQAPDEAVDVEPLAEAVADAAADGADDPAESEPEPIRAALDRDLPDDIDLVALTLAADAALDTGAKGEAVERLLDLAAAYRRERQVDAALDACYLALSLDPDNVGLHLGLVELYDVRGWGGLAGEKLDLLDRLASLDGDDVAARRVAATRAARG